MSATRDFFGDHLVNLAAENSKIVVVNCDLGEATRTLEFKIYIQIDILKQELQKQMQSQYHQD